MPTARYIDDGRPCEGTVWDWCGLLYSCDRHAVGHNAVEALLRGVTPWTPAPALQDAEAWEML